MLYLAPEPAGPFVELTERLAGAFPECPPYGGAFETIVPHLTVGHGSPADLDQAERELASALPRQGVRARAERATLIEDSSGLWKTLREFEFRRARP